MSPLRYDINFNRRALSARSRDRWIGLLRTVGLTAFVGAVVVFSGLYLLLLRERHADVLRQAREARVRAVATTTVAPLVVPSALETISAAKASPRLWAQRLRHLAQDMPDEGTLDELECGADTRDSNTPARGGTLTFSGQIPVSAAQASPTQALTRWMDALQADSTFRRGFKNVNLESSRMITTTDGKAVEFKIVAR